MALAAAFALAARHPVAPAAALALLALWLLALWQRRAVWLVGLPALLPALNFSPWTGWIGFEEFDLAVLGVIGVGYARGALAADAPAPAHDRLVRTLALALAVLTLIGMARGFEDAGGWRFGLFQGYTEPLNTWRVAKPLIYALLLAPLLRAELQHDEVAALRRFALGMLAGVAIVAAASWWERAAYPGVWDFTRRYRTTALFWEMHVGGAAIDAYLALAAPFVMWAVWAARTPLRWAGAALLALAAGYACLATFSRGLYAAIVVSSIVLVMLAAARRARRTGSASPSGRSAGDAILALATLVLLAVVADLHGAAAALGVAFALGCAMLGLRRLAPAGWRGPAGLALALAFAVEVTLAFGPGSFMLNRLAASERDTGSRWAHWRDAVGLLSTPGEWWWGIGLGRFPAHQAAAVSGAEFAGGVAWVADRRADGVPDGHVRLDGPLANDDLGGLYALTQRVATQPRYRLEFDLRGRPGTQVYARVCEVHLIYPMRCQRALRTFDALDGEWRHATLELQGRDLAPWGHVPPRQAVFSLSVSSAAGSADFDRVLLTGADGASMLTNGDFTRGLAHWLPSATQYFVPWHTDSVVLDVLIERGALTLAALLALLSLALKRWARGGLRAAPVLRGVMLASLAGWLCVGLVSSLFDVPRVALLGCLIVAFGLAWRDPVRSGSGQDSA